MKLPVYMDYHATTPMDPAVFDSMAPYFIEKFGNASSKFHTYGWDAEAAVKRARKEVAELINAATHEIVFTSGATESNNLAIKGIAEAYKHKGNHLITVSTEHHAVLDVCKELENKGFRVTYLPVDSEGVLSLDDLKDAITPQTILISIMAANNEIGVISSFQEISELSRKRGVLFHTDAAQALSSLQFDVQKTPIDLMSMSAHKLYGPKGIGALYIRRRHPRVSLQSQMLGGGHEEGFRSGTLNVPGIVGFGTAAHLLRLGFSDDLARVERLRSKLWSGLRTNIMDIVINGSFEKRLSNNLNFIVKGVPAPTLMMELKDVAFSSGAACSSASPEVSHVLNAIGLSESDARSSVRLGIGKFTTEEEVDYVINRFREAVTKIRSIGARINRTRLETPTAA